MTRLATTCCLLLLLAPAARADRASRRTPVVEAVERVAPAVVNISTNQVVAVRVPSRDIFEEFFGRYRRKRVETPLGSGAIIDPDGYVITNEHVVAEASDIIVTLADGTKLEGELVSSDSDNDLALVRIEREEPFPALDMGSSSDLMIGETVIAMGNPFGLESSVTVGILSANNRDVEMQGKPHFKDFLQTDAPINPGNSGGPLLNIDGEMIGINVAIRAEAEGIGFAIPVDRARAILSNLLNFRVINRVWLGFQAQDLTPELAAAFEVNRGIAVNSVEEGSPAAKADLRVGDIITAVDGTAIDDLLSFNRAMMEKGEGDTAVLSVARTGRKLTLRATLAAAPEPPGAEMARRLFGMDLEELDRAKAAQLRLAVRGGLLITGTEPGGSAREAGVRKGDVITHIGRYRITTMKEVATLLRRVKKDDAISIVVVRGYRRLYGRLTAR